MHTFTTRPLTVGLTAIVALTGASAAADSITATYQQGVNDYAGTHDTRLEGDNPTTNYGSEWELLAMGTPTDGIKQSTLIRFDDVFGNDEGQVPNDPNAAITSATLKLWVWSASTHADVPERNNIHVHRMLTDWDADEAVHHYQAYENGQPTGYWGGAGNEQAEEGPVAEIDYAVDDKLTVPFTDQKDYYLEIDITDWARAWQDGTLEDHGLFIFSANEWTGVKMHGSDRYWDGTGDTTRPILEVTYVPEPASLSVLGMLGATVLLSRRSRRL